MHQELGSLQQVQLLLIILLLVVAVPQDGVVVLEVVQVDLEQVLRYL